MADDSSQKPSSETESVGEDDPPPKAPSTPHGFQERAFAGHAFAGNAFAMGDPAVSETATDGTRSVDGGARGVHGAPAYSGGVRGVGGPIGSGPIGSLEDEGRTSGQALGEFAHGEFPDRENNRPVEPSEVSTRSLRDQVVAQRLRLDAPGILIKINSLEHSLENEISRLRSSAPNEPNEIEAHRGFVNFLVNLIGELRELAKQINLAIEAKGQPGEKIFMGKAAEAVSAIEAKVVSEWSRNGEKHVGRALKISTYIAAGAVVNALGLSDLLGNAAGKLWK